MKELKETMSNEELLRAIALTSRELKGRSGKLKALLEFHLDQLLQEQRVRARQRTLETP